MKKTNQIILGIFFLFALGSQVAAQSIFKNGDIPNDLVITLNLSSTSQFASEYDYKITSDGRVFFEDRSHNLPAYPSFGALLKKNKLKKPTLKDKLSKRQLRDIVREFENSGFFEMNEYYRGDPNLTEATCINHADIKGLSVSANGKIKKVVFFLGCGYGEKSPFHRFLNLYNKVDAVLKGVKAEKPEKSNDS